MNFHSVRIKAMAMTAVLAAVGFSAMGAKPGVKNLKCNSLTEPVGVMSPTFSWQIDDATKGTAQAAYELRVARSEADLKSDSKLRCTTTGLVQSGEQVRVSIDRNANVVSAHMGVGAQGADYTLSSKFQPATKYWWQVRVVTTDGRKSGWSKPATFVTGLPNSSWKGKWIGPETDKCKTEAYLRTTFSVAKKPVLAVAYVCALGCGDLWVNGKMADESRILDPAQTNYEQYALYSAHDVTDAIVRGENCVGVALGSGWYHQNVVWGGKLGNYGNPKVRLQLVMRFADGSSQTVVSDENWKWSESPTLKSNIYAGESYDARREIAGWASAKTDASGWANAVELTDAVPPMLLPQVMEPIRTHDVVKPVNSWRDPEGRWIIDFGENMAALPRLFNLNLPAGTTLKMRMGEYSHPDSAIDFRSTGVGATGVVQTDEYTCRGAQNESWMPRFTYHGFRYLELTGIDELPTTPFIEAVKVYSAVRPIATFESDNDVLNRLHQLALNTMHSNMHGLPTDCPARERCGWLGDAHAVFPFEALNADVDNFYVKYMADVNSSANFEAKNTLFHDYGNRVFYHRDKPVGLSYMIAPGRRQCGVASPDWGTAQVQLPWNLYWYYGNREEMSRSYEYMTEWVKHISEMKVGGIVPYGLGDWCSMTPDGKPETNHKLTSTAFNYRDLTLMRDMARELGRDADAARYERELREVGKALVDTFYNAANHTFGTQTADAMALGYGFVPKGDEEAVANSIVRVSKEQHDGFMSVGIFGMCHIGQALSRNGKAKEAVDIMTKTGYNSFEWMWTKYDATTLWELLPVNDSCVHLTSSLSHPMQGGYDQWIIEDVGGVRAAAPGYKKLHFEHVSGTKVKSAKVTLDTPYGMAVSDWNENGASTMVWNITIPASTTADVVIPAGAKSVNVDGKQVTTTSTDARGNGIVTLGAGSYRLQIAL